MAKANTTYSNISSKSKAQLATQLTELRKEQLNLRFQKAAGQLGNFNRWREVRKSVARAKTALRATELKLGSKS